MTASSYPLDKKQRGRPSSGNGQTVVDNRSHAPENARYSLISHLCVICFGRLLKRRLPGRKPRFEVICSNCGDVHFIEGDEHVKCWCTKHIETIGTDVHGFIFECFKNPNRRPEVPNQFLVQEKKINISVPEARISRPAFSTPTDYL
jgi:hypothetical protein